MQSQSSEKKKKEYDFALLRRRPLYVRADILAVIAVTVALISNFGF